MANTAGLADEDRRTPTATSLAALDRINLFLAAVLSGFGPYVAAFLAEQNWTPQDIGFVLTAAAVAGLVSQTPAGELLDRTQAKRPAVMLAVAMIGGAALGIALWPSFPSVLTSLMIQAAAGGFLGLGIASVSLGLVGHAEFGERLGRNQRFASAGGVFGAAFMGLASYFLSYRAIFLVAAALVLPLLAALSRIKPSDIHFEAACGMAHEDGPIRPGRARRLSLWKCRGLAVFACAVFLFQLANASVLPLAAETLAHTEGAALVTSALIIVPQAIVALMAPQMGRWAKALGRRPLLLVGFAALPVRAVVFAWTSEPFILIPAQILDGISGTVLGVLTALTVADVTAGSGRFNLAQGFVGTMSGLGGSVSTTLSGQIIGAFGRTAAFLSIAGVGLAAVLLLWLLMPETRPPVNGLRGGAAVQKRHDA
ncbi:MAG: MFS transporter [Rhodomicrobium sp.]